MAIEARQKARETTTDDPILIGREAAAGLLGVSVETWDRLRLAGKTPRPLRLGARLLFNRAELAAWVEAGAPDRATWDAMTADPKRPNGRRPAPRG